MNSNTIVRSWVKHIKYDTPGRVIERCDPSACVNYILTVSNGWVIAVTPDNQGTAGIVHTYQYLPNMPEAVIHKFRHGTSTNSNPEYLQEKRTYISQNFGKTNAWYLQKEISYPTLTTDENASDRLETTHSYTFYATTLAVETETIAYPAVSTGKNGTGVAATTTRHFKRDLTSNLYYNDWTKHEDGTLSYTEQSANAKLLGRVTKTIQDVDTSRTDDFSGLPSGWTTPLHGGAHLVTIHRYFGENTNDTLRLGELKETVNPDGRTNRNERFNISRVSNGTLTTLGSVTVSAIDGDPVSIHVSDPVGKTLISASGLAATGPLSAYISASYLDGTVDICDLQNGLVSGVRLVSRTDSLYDGSGKLVEARQYHRIPTSGEGAQTDDYLATKFCYDAVTGQRIRQVQVISGTTCTNSVEIVTKKVYDQHNRVVQTLQGLSDASHNIGCTCENDPPLSLLSETFYDQATSGNGSSGVGDGNVTESRRYHGTNATDYTATVMNYDWRNRQTATFSPGGIAQISTLDNMGRAVTNQTYANATLDGNGVIQVLSANLRAQLATHFDERDQVWKTEQFSVDQSNGTVGASLANLSWFDAAGRQIKSLGPDGLIRKTQYNGLGGAKYQFLSTTEGSDTDPATIADDTLVSVTESVLDNTKGGRQIAVKQGTSMANLVTVSKTWYDTNVDGTGTEQFRVTGQSSLKASDSASDFVTTKFLYDDAGRQYGTISPDPDGTGPLATLQSEQVFDAIGRSISNLVFICGNPRLLISASSSHYLGPRLTETRQYKVVSGVATDYLPTKYYFDSFGRQCKVEQASGQFQKSLFNLAGQTLAQYLCASEGANTDPASITDDTVIEQTLYTFDSACRPIVVAHFQCHDNATGTGELTTSNARTSYSAVWYDDMSRQQTMADYGATNSFTRPGTAPTPNSSDDIMVTLNAFDGFGRQSTVTDNKGIVKKMLYDDAGRLTHTIENYNNFAVVSGQDTGTGDATDQSKDRVIKSVYDLQSRVVQQILLDQNGDSNTNDNQVTRNVYGVDTGCAVSREVLLKVIYPDGNDTTDNVRYTYYANGARKTQTDQRGVVHQYTYDDAGRLTADIVTDLGLSGIVDGSVRRIDYGYDNLGRQTFVRSRCSGDVSSPITNEVAYTYSDSAWGQLVKVAQAHTGPADASTPAMQYTWEDGAVGGIAKYVRQATKIYPNGRVVTNQYNAGTDNILSRISGVTAPGSTNALIQYTYLGAGTIVELAHPAVSSSGAGPTGAGLVLSYGTNGVYPGFDRFGRVLDQKWTVGTNIVDRFQYTHDRLGNRIARKVAWAQGLDVTEAYNYDGLQQLTNMVRDASILWNQPPTVFITTPTNNTDIITGANVTINASAADADGTISLVEFLVNGVKIGDDASIPYSCLWTNAPMGRHILTAKAADNSGAETVSLGVVVNVGPVLSVSVTDTEASEPNSPLNKGNGTFRISRTGPKTATLFVRYAMSGASSNGLDYTTLTGGVTIAVNQSYVDVSVVPKSDALVEGDESVILYLLSSSAYSTNPLASTGTVTLYDATYDTPVAGLTLADADASEPNFIPNRGNAVFRFTRGGSLHTNLTVNYTIAGTAINGADYNTISGSVTILVNAAYADVTIVPKSDALVEGSESVALTLASGSYVVNPLQTNAVALLYDADYTLPTITLTVPDALASESGAPTNFGNGTFRIARSGTVNAPLTVFYTMSGAADNGVDYTALTGAVTLAASVAQVDLSFVPIADRLIEGGETVTLTLLPNAAYVVPATNSGTVTLHDANYSTVPTVSVVASDSESSEPGGAYGNGTFRIARSGATTAALLIRYNMSGTASNGADYTSLTGAVTLAIGQSSTNLILNPLTDALTETWESAVLSISGLTTYAMSPTSAVATIIIYDVGASNRAPTAVADTYSTPEDIILTIAASGVLGNDTDPDGDPLVAVLVATPTKGTLNLNANGSFVYIPFANTNGTDSFTYKTRDPKNGESATVGVTIDIGSSNDAPSVSITSPTNNTDTTVGTNVTIDADASDLDGTVTNVAFYIDAVKIADDASAPYSCLWTNAPMGRHILTAKATDNNGAQTLSAGIVVNVGAVVSVSVTDPEASEPNSPLNKGNGTFRIFRTGPRTATLFVQYAISGTASNGGDYNVLTGGVTIAVNQFYVDVTVVPKADALVESAETVAFSLVPASAYSLNALASTGTVTLYDATYDTPVVGLTLADADASEPNSIPNRGNAIFRFTRSSSLHTNLTVNYAIAGTAVNGTDYNTIASSVTIPVNAATADVTIVPKSDASVEGTESVALTLASGSYVANPLQTNAVVLLYDADYATPVITLTVPDALASESGAPTNFGNGTFRIARSGTVNAPLTVFYTMSGTADNGTDYTALTGAVTLAASVAQVDLSFVPIADRLIEGGETATLTLLPNAAYVVPTTNSGTVTLHDASYSTVPTVSVVASDSESSEPGGAYGNGTFRIARSGATTAALLVRYNMSGTASNGADYTSLTGAVTLAIGQSSTNLNLTALTDALTEGNEFATLSISGLTTYAMSPTSVAATVWIYDVGTDNHTPVALADAYTCQPNSVLSVGPSGVLANDVDPDSDPLQAILVTGVAHGVLTLKSNGSFVYSPTAGWVGEDVFTYRVTDGRLQSTPISVTIQVGSGSVPYALADEKSQFWFLEPAGNWAQFRDSTNVENRTHNIFNEITGINGDASAVTHDAAGNMTSLRGRACLSGTADLNLKWDSWNRLTRLSDTSDITIATYTYDGDWKRLKKVVGTATTEYYYDDMQLAEIRHMSATSVVPEMVESLVYDTRYLHSLAYRDVYSGLTATLVTRHAFLNDANFNVTALISTNGTVVERYTYDPYGKVTIRDANWQPITWDASQKNVCLYTGHKFDAESGLYYSLYRYYHPGLGRWMARDPIAERGGMSFLLYCGNDPRNRTDPLGLSALSPPWWNSMWAGIYRFFGAEDAAKKAEEDAIMSSLANEHGRSDLFGTALPLRANLIRKEPFPQEIVQGQMATRAVLTYSSAAAVTIEGAVSVGAFAPAAATKGAIICGGVEGWKQTISGKHDRSQMVMAAGTGWFAGPMFAASYEMGTVGRGINTLIIGSGTVRSYMEVPKLIRSGGSRREVAGQVFEGSVGLLFTSMSTLSMLESSNPKWFYRPGPDTQFESLAKDKPWRYDLGQLMVRSSTYTELAKPNAAQLPTIDPVARTQQGGWFRILTSWSPRGLVSNLGSGPGPTARNAIVAPLWHEGGGANTVFLLIPNEEER